jgi:hypothetical protein
VLGEQAVPDIAAIDVIAAAMVVLPARPRVAASRAFEFHAACRQRLDPR